MLPGLRAERHRVMKQGLRLLIAYGLSALADASVHSSALDTQVHAAFALPWQLHRGAGPSALSRRARVRPSAVKPAWRVGRALTTMAASSDMLAVEIESLSDPQYLRMLSKLCCDSFYGEQTPLEALNLYANLQRALVLQEIEQDLVPCVNYSEFNR